MPSLLFAALALAATSPARAEAPKWEHHTFDVGVLTNIPSCTSFAVEGYEGTDCAGAAALAGDGLHRLGRHFTLGWTARGGLGYNTDLQFVHEIADEVTDRVPFQNVQLNLAALPGVRFGSDGMEMRVLAGPVFEVARVTEGSRLRLEEIALSVDPLGQVYAGGHLQAALDFAVGRRLRLGPRLQAQVQRTVGAIYSDMVRDDPELKEEMDLYHLHRTYIAAWPSVAVDVGTGPALHVEVATPSFSRSSTDRSTWEQLQEEGWETERTSSDLSLSPLFHLALQLRL